MPVILVIIIAVAWIAILGPRLLSRRSRSVGEIGSISHFHRQLRVLEHSGPQPIVTPAYRLRSFDGSGQPQRTISYPGAGDAPVLSVVGAKELPRPALAFLGDTPEEPLAAAPASYYDAVYGDPGYRSGGARSVEAMGTPVRSSGDPVARHHIRRRRRDTLGVLALLFVGTLMIGFVPGAAVAWCVSAAAGVVLVGYVALLVHLRRLAEERERKLHYLRPEGPGGPAVGVHAPISGRYAHPSNQAVAAR
jgi:hypothetical protein